MKKQDFKGSQILKIAILLDNLMNMRLLSLLNMKDYGDWKQGRVMDKQHKFFKIKGCLRTQNIQE